MSARLDAGRARTHEALYPRLEALAAQVAAIAARQPGAAVPEIVRAAAEALLFDAQRFGRPRPPRGLPPAPETYAALATALGQALAQLDAFEIAHSAWSPEHNGFVWLLPRGALLPVQRLRPKSALRPDPVRTRESNAIREKLLHRIAAKYDEGFDAGMKAAREGQSTPDVIPAKAGIQ